MGSKIIRVVDLEYRDTECDISDKALEYPDLVRTLRFDPTKYFKPVLDENGQLIRNSIFLKAAKEAGLERVIVQVPGDSEVDYSQFYDEGIIADPYVFFDDPNFSDRNAIDEVFLNAFEDFKETIYHPLLDGDTIDVLRHKIIMPDVIHYCLEGHLKGERNLSKPFSRLDSRLERTVGKIRSISGIKWVMKS